MLFADGAVELVVERIEDGDVHCRVVAGGRLFSNKGINLPGRPLSVQTLTEKDRRDLAFIAKADIDIVAISFVRSPNDIAEARACLGHSKLPVMAKLERPEALDALEPILEASDGVMVARGDLGVELPFEQVPLLQKQILEHAALRGKWAVVATQMLGSMVTRPADARRGVGRGERGARRHRRRDAVRRDRRGALPRGERARDRPDHARRRAEPRLPPRARRARPSSLPDRP